MKKVLNYLTKEFILFIIGGILYMIIELLWRGYTHWSMGILGGLCFVLMGLINEVFTYEMYIEIQAIISAIVITVLEFFAGLLVNVKLGWDVWDYSDLPFNIMGQVCLLFMVFWFFLSIVGIIMDDYLRFIGFKEENPHYQSWLIDMITLSPDRD